MITPVQTAKQKSILRANQYCPLKLIYSKSSINRIFYTEIEIKICNIVVPYSKATNNVVPHINILQVLHQPFFFYFLSEFRRSAAEGRFLPSHVVTPIMRDWRPHTFLFLFVGEPTWFRRISSHALRFHKPQTTSQSGFGASTNQHASLVKYGEIQIYL